MICCDNLPVKMVSTCSAFGCLNRCKKNSGITFHKFPSIKRSALRKKWVMAMKRKGFRPGNDSKVCSDHFKSEDFQNGLKVRALRRDAIPKVIIGGKSEEKTPRRVLKRAQLPAVLSNDNVPCASERIGVSLEPPPNKRAKLETDVASKELLKKCDMCPFKSNKHQLGRHVKKAHLKGEKKFKCEHCPYATVSNSDLQRHVKGVHEKKKNQYLPAPIKVSTESQTETNVTDVAVQTCPEGAQGVRKSQNTHLLDHNYACSPFIDDLKKRCQYLQDVIQKKEANEDKLRKKVARLRDKNLKLHDVIFELRKEELVTKEAALFLGERFSDVEFKLIKGLVFEKNPGLSYQEEVKDFSITLFYYREG